MTVTVSHNARRLIKAFSCWTYGRTGQRDEAKSVRALNVDLQNQLRCAAPVARHRRDLQGQRSRSRDASDLGVDRQVENETS